MISNKQHVALIKTFRKHPEHTNRKTAYVIFNMLIAMYAPRNMSRETTQEFEDSVVAQFVERYNPQKGSPIGTLISIIKTTLQPKEVSTSYKLDLRYDTIEGGNI